MTTSSEKWPTELDASEVAWRVHGKPPESVRRFSEGIGHWVYDVRMPDGSRSVVKLGTAVQRTEFLGAIHWSKTLRPLGVPLPKLLAHGEHRELPYVVLERLDGEDLGQVYGSLSLVQRRLIAEEVCRVQQIVGKLPEGDGYGFVRLPGESSYHKSWMGVIEASLARSRGRIATAGLVSMRPIERVEEAAKRFDDYFRRVRPKPFLDDVTTKNVLVHAGRFGGIVDVDWLCFGDPLFTVALTRAALLSSGFDSVYTDHWCRVLGVSGKEHRVVLFYTAVFCLDLMSECGQAFNGNGGGLDLERLERLEKILDQHLDEAG